MTATLRVAVRKFPPFERCIVRQFDDFARTTGIDARIEIAALDLGALHDALFARRGLADGTWDIAFLSTDWIAQAQGEGLVANLLPWQEREPVADFPHAWSPSLLNAQRFAGGLWGMPYHDGPQCLIYRSDWLAKAGLDVPRDWDAFVATAGALHAPRQQRYGAAFALFPDGHNSFYDFCVQVWSRGGEVFDGDAQPTLRSDAGRAALAFMRQVAGDRTFTAPAQRELDSVGAGALFRSGQVGLAINWFGFAALAQTDADSAVRGRVGVAPIPAGPHGRSTSLNVYWMLAMAAGSRRQSLAWQFMRHCASAAMDRMTTLEGAIGVRRSTWADPEVNALIPFYHRLDELHAHARMLPRHPRLADIAHAIDTMLSRAIDPAREDAPAGRKSDDALLAAAEHRIREIVQ
jgi:multiple sugar transport system substrate-binding protein